MVVVDDISAHLHVRPATEHASHRYDRAVMPATMAKALTRHLEPDIRVEADGTVWCQIEALAEHGFAPNETTGEIPPRPTALWEQLIVENVDLAAVEQAGQRTHVHVSAATTAPRQAAAVTVNDDAAELVDPVVEARWEQTYGIGSAAAIRTAASIAAGTGAERAGQSCTMRAQVTWPIERSAWVMTTPLTTA